jgi:hypothetical protein
MKITRESVINGKTVSEYEQENGGFHYGGCYREVNSEHGSTEYVYQNTGISEWVILEKNIEFGFFVCTVIGIDQHIYNGRARTFRLAIVDDGYGIDRADWEDNANEDSFEKYKTVQVG